jgi:hypothetical protein
MLLLQLRNNRTDAYGRQTVLGPGHDVFVLVVEDELALSAFTVSTAWLSPLLSRTTVTSSLARRAV